MQRYAAQGANADALRSTLLQRATDEPTRAALQRAIDLSVQRTARTHAQQHTHDLLRAHHALQRQHAQQERAHHEDTLRSVTQRVQARSGGGEALPASVQRHLEAGLNADLSRVRVHTDGEADKLSKLVNAVAFTSGQDIYFQAGRYDPHSASGLELLAHEATHTVQQAQGRVAPGLDPDAGLEQEAQTMGRTLSAATPTSAPTTAPRTTPTRSAGGIQRFANPFKALADKARKLKDDAAKTLSKATSTLRQASAATLKKVQNTPLVKAAKSALNTTTKLITDPKARAAAARQVTTSLTRASQAIKKGAQALNKVVTDPKARNAVIKNIKTRVNTTINTIKDPKARAKLAQQILKNLPKPIKTTIDKAVQVGSQIRTSISQGATKLSKEIATRYAQAKAAGQKFLNATKTAVVQKITALKNDPRVKALGRQLKAAGIQVAKIGTSVLVGGLIIAGAAALTVATGGMSTPVLIAALALSGAAGGAAGQVVENALKHEKGKPLDLFHDISPKSLLTDATLGVVLGPAGKVVGGLAKGLIGGAGKFIARPIAGAVGRLASRSSTLVAAGSALKTGATAAWTAARGLATSTAAHAGTIRQSIRNSLPGQAVRAVGRGAAWVGKQALRGADHIVTPTVNGLKFIGGHAANGVKNAARSVGLDNAINNRLTQANLASAYIGRGIKNAANNVANWTGTQFAPVKNAVKAMGLNAAEKVTQGEMAARNLINTRFGKTLSMDPMRSMTARMTNQASVLARDVRAYASGVGHEIRSEVAAQWAGMAGRTSMLKTTAQIEAAAAVDNTLAAAWHRAQVGARGQLIKQETQALRAAGMTKAAAKRQAKASITPEQITAHAKAHATPSLLAQAKQVYNAKVLPTQLGYDPAQGYLSRLPGMYRQGARLMLQDVRDRGTALRDGFRTGGLTGAGAIGGGWLFEEGTKAAIGNVAGTYKNDKQADYPTLGHVKKGMEDTMSPENMAKFGLTAATGLNATTKSGHIVTVAMPVERLWKLSAQTNGVIASTDAYEVGAPENDAPSPSAPQPQHPAHH
ncbi:DUF4157 domain-containing protein [Deinococcus maricopensis]|uniref:eCIS core domain-containing protein n=1 Tax=Deinococcus maricopensis (strain DSM 21211 / LMG 22137 / NRRL B-23946 / LB-34) TaxID=709986 RepID=E8U4H2_DEIML|nr:DUF4157 domain-containing protein [Deinococcus maricopensis]ADV68837.1 hypothetical protein Deima_3210 [Deinococcus maricopensis DSM 21211]